MQCTIPVSLVSRSMLLQGLIPAFILLACAICLAFYGGMEPKKRTLAVSVLCVVGLVTVSSTAMLAFRSKIVVDGDLVTFYAGIYKATLPMSSLEFSQATPRIGAALRKRTNGTSSGGVNAGWFQDPGGRKVFSLSSSPERVLVPASGRFSVVMDQASFAELERCMATASTGYL